ncbi:MAG: hypothetical protein WC277_00360 [Bacilli bacterium]
METKKYKYHGLVEGEDLKKAFEEGADDMIQTLVQLYANQENLKITYTVRKKGSKEKGKTYTTT